VADLETVGVMPFHRTVFLPDGNFVIHMSPMQNGPTPFRARKTVRGLASGYLSGKQVSK
jgi:hypothetical protein